MRRRAVLTRLLQIAILSVFVMLGSQLIARAAHVVTIVVPYAVGSSTDQVSRVFAREMQRQLGDSFIVINISGVDAYKKVARSTPDGTTLVVYTKRFKQYESDRLISIEQFAPVAVFAKGRGLIAPKNTPPNVIERLEQATELVTKTASFRTAVRRLRLESPFVGSQRFLSEVQTW